MDLISRKEFDRLITSGELENLQAIRVSEGVCLIASKADSKAVVMLRRTDKKPYIWKNELGPSSYAKTRGCSSLAIFYRENLSVSSIKGLQNV
ncbi:hypothetical protein ACEZ6Q_004441 [Salmonella enterica]|jgi:hypothetical protein|uniref:hypothetical protein n=1 Tax=Enterobacteriaceae TaxID=543 RepID=UPI001279C696|nr:MULTISPECIES: hypothetical protein [Enterobacteriaceae]EAS5032282.1 hypothetical protein [Salmonella enterica]EBQ9479077.1 hypothetical protein [Salmonella enterica subsp. enterica serovar Kokomlemle]EDB5955428.1 hypothetical protein [Salmonella enterica subsp. enterica serovar Bareilly]EDV2725956.1 hypothetical protein [Salmonella enterica subsp. enterica serovar Poona]EDX4491321.1 hypothetical protein [Salmonella enterica subsp. salamae]